MQSAPVWLDRVVLLVALGFGVLVQVPGWRIEPRDRALLIRLIGLAASLGLVVSASAILARYHAVTDDDRGRRRRGARVKGARALWVGAAGLLFGGGIAMHFWP
jgi:predicted cation transporter